MVRASNKSLSSPPRKTQRIRSSKSRSKKTRLESKRHFRRVRDIISDGIRELNNSQSNAGKSEYRKNGESKCRDSIPQEDKLTFQQSLNKFLNSVRIMLTNDAIAKGYAEGNTLEANGRRLYDFIQDYAGEGHAGGEIIYKVTRLRRKGDLLDAVKISAWAFLIWDSKQR